MEDVAVDGVGKKPLSELLKCHEKLNTQLGQIYALKCLLVGRMGAVGSE